MVQNIQLKYRKNWTEHEFFEKVASYTKVHFANKYKDVYTVPTANHRLTFNLLDIDYDRKNDGKKLVKKKDPENKSKDNKDSTDKQTTRDGTPKQVDS